MGINPSLDFAEDLDFINLFAKRPDTIKPGLERIRPAWEKLGMDQYPQLNILIAGTNGKGSTAGFLWHLLAANGIKAGLFTSPHLCLFKERFQCSHSPISQSELKHGLHEIKAELGHQLYDELSFFEVSTLLALKAFNERGCSINILEVGLGGRLDSTNIVEPSISVVCSIDLDHTEWLGSELPTIAKEKLGICRKNVPLFWGEQFTEQKGLSSTLLNHQHEVGMPIYLREEHFGLDNKSVWAAFDKASMEGNLPSWVLACSEVIQQNFSLAFGVFAYLKENVDFVQEACHVNPMQNFSAPSIPWPPSLIGRFQTIKVDQDIDNSFKIILDVCHNPAAAEQFVLSYKKLRRNGKIPGYVSILGDKDVSKILKILSEVLDPIYFFEVDSERSLSAMDAKKIIPKPCHVFKDLESGWSQTYHHKKSDCYAICGSFFAVSEALKVFAAYPENGQFISELHGHWHH